MTVSATARTQAKELRKMRWEPAAGLPVVRASVYAAIARPLWSTNCRNLEEVSYRVLANLEGCLGRLLGGCGGEGG